MGRLCGGRLLACFQRLLRVVTGSGQPFSSFGPGLDTYPSTRFDLVGLWLPRTVVANRIAVRYHQQPHFIADSAVLIELAILGFNVTAHLAGRWEWA